MNVIKMMLRVSGILASLFLTISIANATPPGTTVVTSSVGGSGLANPTAHSVLLGEGSSAFGTATIGTAGRLLIDQGAGADPLFGVLSGDCTLTSSGAITCTKTSGTAFGALATVTPGTGVPTALGTNVGSAGAFVVNGGALGTPSSGVGTFLTGLPLTTGVTGTLGVGNGGTGAATMSANAIPKGNGTSPYTASSCNDNGSVFFCNEPITIQQFPMLMTAQSGAAITAGQLLIWNTSGQLIPATTSTTDNIVGIARSSVSSGVTANIVGIIGEQSCTFDGPTTAGDWVTISSTVAGDCHDTGSATRATGQYQIGQVLSTNAGPGSYSVNIENQYTPAGGSGSGNVTGSGTSVVGNLPSFNNTTATGIGDSGVSASNGALNSPKISGNTTHLIPNASGSQQSTTGSISASSSTLTLAAANDFQNGQGIFVNHAGAAFSLNPPTSASATHQGTAGTTTYTYQVASIDAAGGVGAAITAFTVTNGNATLNTTNFNKISWTAPSGTAPNGYAVYGRTGGSVALLGVTTGTSFSDFGFAFTISHPSWLPSAPQGSALNDWLVTTISSGGGTTTLVLAASAASTVSSATVQHDDTAALNAATSALPAAGGIMNVGIGQYNITGSIKLGNGTTSSLSTMNGMVLTSQNNPIWGFWHNQTNVGGSLVWQGNLSTPMVQVNGPLAGWGVKNLFFECNDIAAVGLSGVAVMFGDNQNLAFHKCTEAISLISMPTFSFNDTNSHGNSFVTTVINGLDYGPWVGIILDAATSADDSFTNTFSNLFITDDASISNQSGIGIDLRGTDDDTFTGVYETSTLTPILFDYSGANAGWPGAVVLNAIDPGGGTSVMLNKGTPSGSSTNIIYGLKGTNGATCPTLTNLSCHSN